LSSAMWPKNPTFTGLALTSSSVAPMSAPNRYTFAYAATYASGSKLELATIEAGILSMYPPPETLFETGSLISIAAGSDVLAIATASSNALYFELRDKWPDGVVLGGVELPPQAWMAIAASGSRALLLSPSDMGPTLLVVEAINGAMQELLSGYIANPGPTAGAVALLHGDAFIAFGEPGSLSVRRHVISSPAPQVDQVLAVPGYQGTRIALSAARDRIAVAWLNEGDVVAGQSPGGWALLQCAE
jgi:hypothetical protein